MTVGGRLSVTTEPGGRNRKKVTGQIILNIWISTETFLGELHKHSVQHKPADQAQDENRQDHETPDCHPLSVPHIRVPSGEKLIF